MHQPSVLRGPSRRSHFTSRLPTRTKKLRSRKADADLFRADLVARVRAEIALGTYETPEKLELALTRLLEEVAAGL
jgi:hypothetical protein